MIKKALNPIYGSEFDIESTELKFKYVIYSQQRTGSTWLCNRLINIKKLGVPAEYLNPRGMQEILSNKEKSINIKEYLKILIQKRTSVNGNFGINIQPNQLNGIFKNNIDQKIKFLNSFDKVIVINRKDRLNQAISATISMMTDQWWTYDGKIEKIPEEKLERVMSLIATNLNRLLIDENETEKIVKRLECPVLNIYYNEIEENSENLFRKAVNFLLSDNDFNQLNDYSIVKVPVKADKEIQMDIREKFLSYIS